MASGLWSSGMEGVVVRVTLSCGAESMGLLAHFWGDEEGEMDRKFGYKTHNPTLRYPLPPIRPCFSNVPEPPKTAPTTGGQLFKHMPLWVTFCIQRVYHSICIISFELPCQLFAFFVSEPRSPVGDLLPLPPPPGYS